MIHAQPWDRHECQHLYSTLETKLLRDKHPVRQCVRFLHKSRKILGVQRPKVTRQARCVQTRPVMPIVTMPQQELFDALRSIVPGLTRDELRRAKQRLMRGLARRHCIPRAGSVSPVCACGCSMLFDAVVSDYVCTACGICRHSGPVHDVPVSYTNSCNYTSAEHRVHDVQMAKESIANVCNRHRLGTRCEQNALSMYTTFRDNMQHVEQRPHILAACLAVGASIPLL